MPKQKLVLKTWDFPFDRMLPAVRGPNEVQNGTGVMLYADNAKMPDMLNWFGWGTWDAFYTDVTAEGVKQGLERRY
ncbi:hypothetical protein NL676_012195 [Syzygium grande]|nr:hypothetical protein NL676_012195 [Syzygium grande]